MDLRGFSEPAYLRCDTPLFGQRAEAGRALRPLVASCGGRPSREQPPGGSMRQSPRARFPHHHRTRGLQDRSKSARLPEGHASCEALFALSASALREVAPKEESSEARSHRSLLDGSAHTRTAIAQRLRRQREASGPTGLRQARCIRCARWAFAGSQPQSDQRPSSLGSARRRSARDLSSGRAANGARRPGFPAGSARNRSPRGGTPLRCVRDQSGTPDRCAPSRPESGVGDAPRCHGPDSCCCRSKGGRPAWTRRGLRPFERRVTLA